MWMIAGYVARVTGLGSVVSLLIVLASSAAVLTGTYVYWKHTVVAQRDRYWNQRMTDEKERVENLLLAARAASAKRIEVIEQENTALEERIQNDEVAIDKEPSRDAVGLDANGVSRIDDIH